MQFFRRQRVFRWKMENNSSLLLTSGGLDSTTLAYWLLERELEFQPLFLDYGQHCVETEFETLKRVLPPGLSGKTVRLNISDIYRNSSSRLIQEPDLWVDEVDYRQLYLPYRSLL